MKIRNGFVSNSSSGSFIMQWSMRTFGKDITVERAVGEAFKVFFKVTNDQETNEMDWEGTWNKESKAKVEEVVKNTVKNNDGTFTTTFWTSMNNSGEDFGEAAKALVINILTNDELKIIDTKTESDY